MKLTDLKLEVLRLRHSARCVTPNASFNLRQETSMHNPVISAIITASPAVTTGVTADVNMADADVSSEVR